MRQWLTILVGILYLGGLVLVLSPLWSAGAAESVTITPTKPVQGIRSLGSQSLGSVDVVPSRPPGELSGEGGTVAGEFSESETPQVEGEAETGAPEGSESNEAVTGGGKPEGKSVIGFEG